MVTYTHTYMYIYILTHIYDFIYVKKYKMKNTEDLTCVTWWLGMRWVEKRRKGKGEKQERKRNVTKITGMKVMIQFAKIIYVYMSMYLSFLRH